MDGQLPVEARGAYHMDHAVRAIYPLTLIRLLMAKPDTGLTVPITASIP